MGPVVDCVAIRKDFEHTGEEAAGQTPPAAPLRGHRRELRGVFASGLRILSVKCNHTD